MRKTAICLSLLLFLITNINFGQNTPDNSTNRAELEIQIKKSKAEINRRSRESFEKDDYFYPRKVLIRRRTRTREERKKIELLTKIHEEDIIRHRDFLKQSNTGIFRLYPDFACETKDIIRVDGDCKNFVAGLWAYSLKDEIYTGENFQDLSYKKDNLVTDGLLSQGILVSLGDRDLDELSLTSSGLSFLVNFSPETDLKLIAEQYEKISEGLEKDGFFYSNKLKIEPDTAYALRVISYKYKDKWSSRFSRRNFDKTTREERKFPRLNYNDRNDSIYIFRIIRKNKEDGDITILWKRLSKEKSPKIVFEKSERLRDFKPDK